MRISTYIAALALAASAHVLAEEVTLGVYHKLSDHPSFEKRGEITIDTENWSTAKYTPVATTDKISEVLAQKFKLNVRAAGTGEYPSVDDDHETDETVSDDEATSQGSESVEQQQQPETTTTTTTPEYDENEFPEVKAAQEMYKKGAAEAQAKGPGSVAFYQIQLKDESRKWESLSSIKSCLLVASGFKEEITLHLDQNRRVYGFDYYAGTDTCDEESKKEFQIESLDQFNNVKINVSVGQSGPKARYARAQTIKLDERGKPEAEKTFWQKYWMYIVPALLMFLMAGGEPEKPATAR
ncbi:ER membrane protein complex subunit 10 [Actinomortierella wolfii]|nr:ER membrane protein complex subunit 10 [Actinomortierella wolfii]